MANSDDSNDDKPAQIDVRDFPMFVTPLRWSNDILTDDQ